MSERGVSLEKSGVRKSGLDLRQLAALKAELRAALAGKQICFVRRAAYCNAKTC